jgi:hypothetical protein
MVAKNSLDVKGYRCMSRREETLIRLMLARVQDPQDLLAWAELARSLTGTKVFHDDSSDFAPHGANGILRREILCYHPLPRLLRMCCELHAENLIPKIGSSFCVPSSLARIARVVAALPTSTVDLLMRSRASGYVRTYVHTYIPKATRHAHPVWQTAVSDQLIIRRCHNLAPIAELRTATEIHFANTGSNRHVGEDNLWLSHGDPYGKLLFPTLTRLQISPTEGPQIQGSSSRVVKRRQLNWADPKVDQASRIARHNLKYRSWFPLNHPRAVGFVTLQLDRQSMQLRRHSPHINAHSLIFYIRCNSREMNLSQIDSIRTGNSRIQ